MVEKYANLIRARNKI